MEFTGKIFISQSTSSQVFAEKVFCRVVAVSVVF